VGASVCRWFGNGGGTLESAFFFEKKNQKTFDMKGLLRGWRASQMANVFASFFKKKRLPCLPAAKSEFRHLISATRPEFHNQFIAPSRPIGRSAVPLTVQAML
jgi:hypothetical protein